MRVGIVVHPYGNSSKGLEQYVYESTLAMIAASKNNVSFTIFVKGNPDTSGFPREAEIVHLPNTFVWKFSLLRYRNEIESFIFFTESAPFFLWKKSIVVFLDAAYYYFGSNTFFGRLKRAFVVWWSSAMLHNSKHVVTISHASKKELVEKFSVASDHIRVIYPGFKSQNESYIQDDIKHEKPYFMYVGPMKERKNVLGIVAAFIEFKLRTKLPHELLLIGRRSRGVYGESVRQLISKSQFKDAVVQMEGVLDAELNCLYRGAQALIFPSLIEGFGFPILEALSNECMVITSSTTSTKEVAGDAGFLVNPVETKEIVDAMVRVANGTYDRHAFTESARSQCAKFSWEKAGKEWSTLLMNIH